MEHPDPAQEPESVLPVMDARYERRGNIDVYRPTEGDTVPVVLFVHGGPVPPGRNMRERPLFRAYATQAAARGIAGVTFDHPLYSVEHLQASADAVAAAVEEARNAPGVDGDRGALWFFSGGGLLAADWLRDPPDWLRGVALTYPVVSGAEWGVPKRFLPVDAVGRDGQLPILLTTVGRERPEFQSGVKEFIAASERTGARLDIIDLPNGRHGFDVFDHTDESRAAVRNALDWVATRLA